MGVSISWLACATDDAESLFRDLEIRPTGRCDRYFESTLSAGALDGWVLVVGKRCDHRIASEKVLQHLSEGRDLIACSIEEHVMFHAAARWKEGTCIWSIHHNGGDNGIYDLTAEGDLPQHYESIRSCCFSAQETAGGEDADVDIICEIPLLVAKKITQFKHDEGSVWTSKSVLRECEDCASDRWWKFWK